MTPEEYEHFVAEYYRQLGYETHVTSFSGDYGVDVVARKAGQKIAIQAKKFGGGSRKVNRAMIMELVGATQYAKCDLAVLVTDGGVLPDAAAVAAKLGVQILFLAPEEHSNVLSLSSNHPETAQETTKLVSIPSFDEAWRTFVIPLTGQTITTKTGQVNVILRVDWEGIQRITSKGNEGHISIDPFRYAYSQLQKRGRVTRDEVNQQFKERCSSGVFAVLSTLPFVEVSSEDGKACLKIKT